MVRNPNQTDDVRSNRREEEEEEYESLYELIRIKVLDTKDSHTKNAL